MNELWRRHANYIGVEDAVKDALLQEYLSAAIRPTRGVSVMTIHKSKGKEFSEVLLYEDPYQGRYVRLNATANDIAQARLALRVGVTRAMFRSLILTPRNEPC
jgi:DNA helicase-2/ATP-dependent DNA helicase PcrA